MSKLALGVLLALAAPAWAQEPPRLQRLSGRALAAQAVDSPQPVYPDLAKAAGVEGAVVVEVTADEQGRVVVARAVSGHPLLRDAAVVAAREWLFKPLVLHDVPVKVVGVITFRFELPPAPFDGPPRPVSTETLYSHKRDGDLPRYPPSAMKSEVEGMVQVRLTVSPDGRVASAIPLSGDEALLAAATVVAERWRFDPIEVDGAAVAVTGDVYFLFEEGSPVGSPVLETGEPFRPEEHEPGAGGVPLGAPALDEEHDPGAAPGGDVEPPSEPEPPTTIRVSGGVLPDKAVERPQPEYPVAAMAAGISGAVVVEVVVDVTGRVTAARAVSGHPMLRDAAVEAALAWRFTPTLLSGAPVRVIGTITFNFVAR